MRSSRRLHTRHRVSARRIGPRPRAARASRSLRLRPRRLSAATWPNRPRQRGSRRCCLQRPAVHRKLEPGDRGREGQSKARRLARRQGNRLLAKYRVRVRAAKATSLVICPRNRPPARCFYLRKSSLSRSRSRPLATSSPCIVTKRRIRQGRTVTARRRSRAAAIPGAAAATRKHAEAAAKAMAAAAMVRATAVVAMTALTTRASAAMTVRLI
mmetsp:Transcript_20972/g.45614  ORF Transcript_20972/g.45614 Transcript_20972/m.45614 type:complete len:213 (-) Transcript_20972:481-1119(-)